MSEAADIFPTGVQIGLRVPVILIALAGIVLVLVSIRRIGAAAGVLGALGALVVAVDQIVNIAWVVQLTSMADDGADDGTYATVSNGYTVVDAVLITIAVALLVAAVVARRGATPSASPPQYQQQYPFQQQQ